MGREARCTVRAGDRTGKVKVLLESTELIVRGDYRARVPLASLEVVVRGDSLAFEHAGERIALELGAAVARRWADAISARPPTLARKLGIGAEKRVHVTGSIDDDALADALAQGIVVASIADRVELAIVRTDDRDVLDAWFAHARSAGHEMPVWFVYRKGRDAPLGETAVREIARAAGYVDTKVASVSPALSALRFARRRA